MELGPVQLLVIGFEDGMIPSEILREFRRLRGNDLVRLVDLLFVTRATDGAFEELEGGDPSSKETPTVGALAGALLGLGFENAEIGKSVGPAEEQTRHPTASHAEEVWYLADAIPPGSSAAVALLEHRWAISLRDAIAHAGVENLIDAWVHPDDLAAASNEAADGS